MADESTIDVPKLRRTVAVRFALLAATVAILLFATAGTLDWWQAWAWIASWFVPSLLFTAHYLKADPAMIERRMRTREREREQRTIIRFGWVVSVAAFLLPGLDRRFGWSDVPASLVVASDALVVAGYVLFTRVMRANRYASRTIGVDPGQTVVVTGPYAVVRHPMYASNLLVMLFSPIALGSWPGAGAALLFIPIIVARILNEEKVLARDLAGYARFLGERKHRLVPGIW